ncbi:MAG: hypothetical protein ACT4P4_16220 [Betaproteobacteria bacterium]
MLTLAVILLFLAIFAGVFGTMIAGPVGPVLTVLLLIGFVSSLGMYLYNSRQPPSKGK